MATREHTDFMLRCEKCTPPPGRLVARYQWMDSQGHWIPIAVRGKQNVEVTSMRGDTVDDRWFLHLDESEVAPDGLTLDTEPGDGRPRLRLHHQIRCGTTQCSNAIAADAGHLQFLFHLVERSVADARRPGRRDWVYLLADLVTTDEARRTTTLTLGGLRAALTLNNAKWVRHTRQG